MAYADGNIQDVIAVNIRAERERKGWRQVDLAVSSKVATSGIAAIEAGERDCRIKTLRHLANALGVPIYSLVIEHSDREYAKQPA